MIFEKSQSLGKLVPQRFVFNETDILKVIF